VKESSFSVRNLFSTLMGNLVTPKVWESGDRSQETGENHRATRSFRLLTPDF
jgi:hypothetical protein